LLLFGLHSRPQEAANKPRKSLPRHLCLQSAGIEQPDYSVTTNGIERNAA